jgi:hypothetical protein
VASESALFASTSETRRAPTIAVETRGSERMKLSASALRSTSCSMSGRAQRISFWKMPLVSGRIVTTPTSNSAAHLSALCQAPWWMMLYLIWMTSNSPVSRNGRRLEDSSHVMPTKRILPSCLSCW